MAIPYRCVCALAAVLSLPCVSLSQPADSTPPVSATEVPQMLDNATPRGGGAREGGISTGPGSVTQRPSPADDKGHSKEGTGPDPTTVQEPPSITGKGTAGEDP
jgi:hypothetical protein